MKTKIELFCGTGGVGKTTLAVSRALDLAKNGKRVLIITIDPSIRLKDYLGLKKEQVGELTDVESVQNLWALLMSPTATLDKVAKIHQLENEFQSRIIQSLSRPYGGMNEIMAMVELYLHYKENTYDYIVLDTPPGGHFVDFLESTQKINTFFDHSFIEIFKFLQSKTEGKTTGFMKRLVSSGIKKILGYLEQITGPSFLDDFVDAINSIYKTKDSFLGALEMQKVLKNPDYCDWYLVTSTDHNKISQAASLNDLTEKQLNSKGNIIVNKCLAEYFKETAYEDELLNQIEDSFQRKETSVKKLAKLNFENIYYFPDVLSSDIDQHIQQLSASWQKVAQ